jgi:hypothetical protein
MNAGDESWPTQWHGIMDLVHLYTGIKGGAGIVAPCSTGWERTFFYWTLYLHNERDLSPSSLEFIAWVYENYRLAGSVS